MKGLIKSHKELNVWNDAMDAAMKIFELTKHFPISERYSLVDQIRRSSRSVAANLSEAWRKRRYQAAFISKLSDAESEACETQTWLEFCKRCGYLKKEEVEILDKKYEIIQAKIVRMIQTSKSWTFTN